VATPENNRDRLIRVRGPALPVAALVSEPDLAEPVSELSRVRGPAVRVVALMSEPVEPAILEAAHPAAGGKNEVGRLSSFIEKLNEADSIFNRPGVRIDESRSGVRDGRVVLVLTPNDPADAVETCKRVADYLFAAIRTIPGATVRVFVADQPDKPVYELAS
jgi:hypothetical protein